MSGPDRFPIWLALVLLCVGTFLNKSSIRDIEKQMSALEEWRQAVTPTPAPPCPEGKICRLTLGLEVVGSGVTMWNTIPTTVHLPPKCNEGESATIGGSRFRCVANDWKLLAEAAK